MENEKNPPHIRIVFGMGFLVGALATGFVGFTSDPGFLFVALACLGGGTLLATNGISEIVKKRRSIPPPISEEQKILHAVADGEGITPTEAAMETSVPVREADRILSELASGGHLKVESEDGALVYSLPKRRKRELA